MGHFTGELGGRNYGKSAGAVLLFLGAAARRLQNEAAGHSGVQPDCGPGSGGGVKGLLTRAGGGLLFEGDRLVRPSQSGRG
ncbi:hypothetical protein D1872_304380 [compost metagenome]